jgi:hypothetical protein
MDFTPFSKVSIMPGELTGAFAEYCRTGRSGKAKPSGGVERYESLNAAQAYCEHVAQDVETSWGQIVGPHELVKYQAPGGLDARHRQVPNDLRTKHKAREFALETK